MTDFIKEKVRTVSELVGFIFAQIGGAFLLIVLLSVINPDMIKNVNGVFFAIGAGMLILGILAYWISCSKRKNVDSLKETGEIAVARVLDVKKVSLIRLSQQTPFVIHFEYSIGTEHHKGKSFLYWDRPDVKVNDIMTLYIDEKTPGKYLLGEKIEYEM